MTEWKQVTPEECLQWQLKNRNCEAVRKMSILEYPVKYRFGFFYSQHGGEDATEWVYSQDPGNPAYTYFIPEETP